MHLLNLRFLFDIALSETLNSLLSEKKNNNNRAENACRQKKTQEKSSMWVKCGCMWNSGESQESIKPVN